MKKYIPHILPSNTHAFNLGFPMFVVFVLLGPFAARAQHRAHVQPHVSSQKIARIQTHIMASRLNLKPQQQEKVSQLNERYMSRLTELLKNGTLSKEDKLAELQKIRENKKTDMKEILSEDQYKAYLKLQQDLKEERRQKSRDEPAPASEDGTE